MSIDPETTRAAGDGFSIFMKIATPIVTFIGGIITATWMVAVKVSGYEVKIKLLEAEVEAIKEKAEKEFDEKRKREEKTVKVLEALHKRLDSLMLTAQCHFRKEERGE